MNKLSQLACSLLVLCAGTAFAQPTNRLFVTNEEDNTVTVVNAGSLQVEKTIEVGNRPRGIGLSP
ncbi:MAG: PQQ-dependent catabolism-associated beta-propeller protein, partial [Pseudomonadota bacterium]|nr:PQQ-dependent catabolism-associated beta-propeller protein [Pseudomonadota bacterium]